jgi:hypothetical protein
MKARLLSTAIRTGHAALDFIRLAQRNDHSSASAARPKAQLANAILESLDDQDRTLPDFAVPIKRLVTVLTESLHGMPLDNPGDRIEGAKLYRGCKVQLRGIPERRFIIRDIYWDDQEVRVKELGAEIYYLLPWDCIEFDEEQER